MILIFERILSCNLISSLTETEAQAAYRLQCFSSNVPLDLALSPRFRTLYHFVGGSAGWFHANKSKAQETSQWVRSYARCLIKEGKKWTCYRRAAKKKKRKDLFVFLQRFLGGEMFHCSQQTGTLSQPPLHAHTKHTPTRTHYLSISTCLINLRRIKFEKVISHIFH